MSMLLFAEAFAVKVPTSVPFFWMVNVALLTVGIVGVPDRSEYSPLFATAAKSSGCTAVAPASAPLRMSSRSLIVACLFFSRSVTLSCKLCTFPVKSDTPLDKPSKYAKTPPDVIIFLEPSVGVVSAASCVANTLPLDWEIVLI